MWGARIAGWLCLCAAVQAQSRAQFPAPLRAQIDHVMWEPGQRVTLWLTPRGAAHQPGDSKFLLSIYLVGGPPGGPRETELARGAAIGPGLVPFSTRLTVPEVAAGNYTLEARLFEPDQRGPASAAFKVRLPVHIEYLPERAQRLGRRLARVGERNSPALPTVEYTLRFYEEVDKGLAGLRRFGTYDFRASFDMAEAILDDLEVGRKPWAGRYGDLRKAYRSAVDQSLQPYRMYVPSADNGSRALPLVVALHGAGGDQNEFFDGYRAAPLMPEAERWGFLVVSPKGRNPDSGYRGAAERDVLDVMAEVRRDYAVDPDRIYLMGHSMGAYATWRLAMKYPELFAGLGPIAGGGDPRGMTKIRHIPEYVVHGAADETIPVEESRRMVGAVRQLGVEITYVEVPGAGHFDAAVGQFAPMLGFFARQRKARSR